MADEGGKMVFKPISVRARAKLFDAFRARATNATACDDLDFKLAVIGATAHAEDGSKKFGDEASLQELENLTPDQFEPIADAAMKAAGFGGGDRVKPSGETTSAGSPTG